MQKNNNINNKYYLYCHSCGNRPFYIGIGTKRTGNEDYSRARNLSTRNHIWKKFYENCKDEVSFDICEESNDQDFIAFREKCWIMELGRWIKQKDGLLSNISEGGENLYRERIKVIQYDLNGNLVKIWDDIQSAANNNNCTYGGILAACKPNSSCRKSQWRKWKENYEIKIDKYFNHSLQSVAQYDRNNKFIDSYPSIADASRKLKIISSSINECCRNKRKTAGNYIWKYYKENKNEP